MKKITKIFASLSIVMLLGSCEKFEEFNTNPNVPSTVTPELLATQILKDTYRFWNPNPTDFGTANLWAKHAVMLETNPNPYQYYYSYSPYGSFGGMQKLPTLNKMAQLAEGNLNESSYKGLAKFMKAWYGIGMTLDMGDVPYSEAGKLEEGIRTPKYDKQEDVFKQILVDLKDAEALFAAGKSFNGDIMFGGNPVKWRRLANAVQLKVLNVLSKKSNS
ncbi:MAG: SusD/RagB family nutrient-binding outer membrane lipoprotein [Cytophagaceae bacterium]|nr:SusD/RagB family nutrient-binding outer membrane lipoprotein [Cytophagaceae bacterium]